MSASSAAWPDSARLSLLAAGATWVTLWTWSGFVERPSGYLLPTLGVCLAVAGTGTVLRAVRLPAVLVALVQVALLGLWLNRSWAPELSTRGWIPTSWSLQEVAAQISAGVQAAASYAAPVPDTVPQIDALLVVAGAGAAVLVDFLACGVRRVPLAGLPLLAVYTAPVSILEGGLAWWKFAAAALSFLFLLAADEARVQGRWGRQLSGGLPASDTVTATVTSAALRSSARKIGFTATGLAVLVPVFLPTWSSGLFPQAGNGSGGGDSVAITNPMVDLRRDLVRGNDVDLLWIRTREPDPSYLRISVLDSFDGETWRPSGRDIPVRQRASGRLPQPPGLGPEVPRREVPYRISIGSAFTSQWLPTPYPVSSIQAPGDWRYDTRTLDFISAADEQTTRNFDYTLRALDLRPTAQMLAAAGAPPQDVYTANTRVPDSVPDWVRTLAQRLTARQQTKFEKAVRLQNWFRADGGFTYSLERSPGNGTDELARFLGNGPDSRVGYCEQFAASMALMGRLLGIPTRIAVGFLRPTQEADGLWVYSSHDLHAWPEMYFEGVGWTRFEPTPPADQTTAVPSYTREELPQDRPAAPAPSGPAPQQQNRIDAPTTAPGATAPSGQNPSGGAAAGTGPIALVVGALVLGVASGPRLLRSALRRRRRAAATTAAQRAEAAWAELRDSATDLGVPWDESVTLRTLARRLVLNFGEADAGPERGTARAPRRGPDAHPEATRALEALVRTVERARYARSMPDPLDDDLDADLALCVQAVRDGATRGRRLRATWLPASLFMRLWSAAGPARPGEDEVARAGEPGVDHAT